MLGGFHTGTISNDWNISHGTRHKIRDLSLLESSDRGTRVLESGVDWHLRMIECMEDSEGCTELNNLGVIAV